MCAISSTIDIIIIKRLGSIEPTEPFHGTAKMKSTKLNSNELNSI